MPKRYVYLDHAAATPLDTEVIKAMEPFYAADFYNPAATYSGARDVRAKIEKAKKTIGSLMGIKPTEIVFTSGGTEANNLAVHGVMQQFPDKKVLVSRIEHESVLEPAKRWNYSELAVDSQALVDIKKLEEKLDDNVVLVSVMLANNEVGTIEPIREIAGIIDKARRERKKRNIKAPLLFHTDAIQAPLYLDIHPHRLGVDLMTISGGKIYGPKNAGLLFIKAGVRLEPILHGGGQQRGLRSGTESPASAVGLAKALEIAREKRASESERLKALQKYFFEKIGASIPDTVINGSLKRRLPNNLHVTIEGADNEDLINKLDELGIMVAAGSACTAANDEPSHVLRAMGVNDEDARSSLRLTMGRATTKEELDRTINALAELAS